MKKIKRWLPIIILGIFLIPLTNSCKIGDEDPGFSLFSRKHRLCQDWKFSHFKRIVQRNDKMEINEFNGSSYVTIKSNKTYVSSATMTLSFNKNGTYEWNEYISNDTSTYTYKEEGYWYFTGGGKDTDTQFKELLALQKTKSNTTLQVGGTTTTSTYEGSGNLETTVFRLIKLSMDEVKMVSKVEKQYIQGSNTTLEIVTIEINLKMNV